MYLLRKQNIVDFICKENTKMIANQIMEEKNKTVQSSGLCGLKIPTIFSARSGQKGQSK